MKKTIYRLSGVVLAVSGLMPLSSWSAESGAGSSEVEQLRQQLNELNRRYEVQGATLQQLSQRLQQLENTGQARPVRAVKTVAAGEESGNPDTRDSAAPVQAQAAAEDGEPVVKEAPLSRSAEAVYREQNALFYNTFTLETGVTYTHSDRRQLTLEGFLALDAIFLGRINLDRVKSDIVQLDVTGRYGITERLQVDFNAPFLYRSSTYESGGVGGSAPTLGDHDVSNSDIGDISAGVYYRLFQETPTSPDVVFNARLKAPTGKDPYGIKFRTVPGNNNLSAPDDLPTGNGVWTLSTGLTFVKTVDPAILFANIGYAHNFTRGFSDISGDPNLKISGEIDLGDSYQLGGGLAFALNDRMSFSTSYAHRFTQKSRIKQDGQSWSSVVGSDSSSGLLNFGVTYAMTDRLSMVTNVGLGVTPDAPDISVGIKFPYNF
jgi:opacity protein-like surface antigen